ncbi:cytochrome P450 [Nocardia spumae]|uniref:cytochrome P450 n=1 Tax=Nocardia spumae TaxID=2887190 RepID=UPI001D13AA7B|nr:cytochrome P450 [Nocardia spumae]
MTVRRSRGERVLPAAPTAHCFPFAARTPNQMSFTERDQRYRLLHQWPGSSFAHDSGLHMIWKYQDVREVLAAATPGISNANALDPLVGFPRIAMNARALPHLFRDLVPLPSKATANATDPVLHKQIWDAMAGPDGFFTIPAARRDECREELAEHFRAVCDPSAGRDDGLLDVTTMSITYAARVTASAVGVSAHHWPRLAEWSGAQSGLLGRRMRGRELAVAVHGLGRLFAVSAQSVLSAPAAAPSFAGHLREHGIPDRPAIAAMANSLAAGVHTISGTIQQGVQRLLADPDRTWWNTLADPVQAPRVAAKILQLDPGLVAWKRRADRRVVLRSGTTLPKGQILVLFAAANRDPAAFGDPLVLGGSGKMPLTFGFGTHICPGRQLATAAVEVFLTQLAELSPQARPVPESDPPRSPDLLFSGADVLVRR